MKSFSCIAALTILLGNTAALAQTPASQPPAASSATGSESTAQRRECRQQARQIDDPQERQRILRECRQDTQNSSAVSAPSSAAASAPSQPPPVVDLPPSTAVPAAANGGPAALNPGAQPPPASLSTPTAQSTPMPDATSATPSADELRQQRQQREQRRQQRGQPAQGGAVQIYPNEDDVQAQQTRELTGQGNRRNWRDDAGFGNRGQRLQQLEQRVDALERMLQEVLDNQRRLLHETPPPRR